MKKLRFAALVLAATCTVGVGTASASHTWDGMHWARLSNPFTLALGNNLGSSWTSYVAPVVSDWSQSTVLDLTAVSGARKKRCGAVAGRVEVCNDTYGRNGWLGLASVWASGGHIVQATVKMNDTYYNTSTYNTPAWRQSVLCQEVGHTFGLGHQSEDYNVDMDTCMDYYKVPNLHPNAHDWEQISALYAHGDSKTTLGAGSHAGSARGLRRVKDGTYAENYGNGNVRIVFVNWKDKNQPHSAPDEG